MKRTIPLEVLLSLTTGRLLCDFSAMHEAAEFIVGHSIWTHEFADKLLNAHIRERILEQCPELAAATGEGITPDNYLEFLGRIRAELGAEREIHAGDEVRHISPMDTARELMPNAKILSIVIDSAPDRGPTL